MHGLAGTQGFYGSGARVLALALLAGLLGPQRLREVLLACADHHGPAALQVTHLDQAAIDLHERAVAAVLGQPVGTAHRSRAVPATGAEAAVAVAPEAAARPLAAAGGEHVGG